MTPEMRQAAACQHLYTRLAESENHEACLDCGALRPVYVNGACVEDRGPWLLPASGLTAAFAHAATAAADMRVAFDGIGKSLRRLQKLCDRMCPGAARYYRRRERLRRYRQAGRYRRHVGRVR